MSGLLESGKPTCISCGENPRFLKTIKLAFGGGIKGKTGVQAGVQKQILKT